MDFTVWTVFIRFEKNNLELHEYVSMLYKVYYNVYVVHKVCYNDNYCHTVIPGKAATLKYNQGQKSIRFLFLNYAVAKSLLED